MGNKLKGAVGNLSHNSSMLPHLPSHKVLSDYVVRILGFNPGPRTLQGTNSYLVGARHMPRILIDTTNRGANLSSYIFTLEQELGKWREGPSPLCGIILTHWHPDHTQAVQAVLDLNNRLKRRSPNVLSENVHTIPVYKYPGPNLCQLGFFDGPVTDLYSDQVISLDPSLPDPNSGLTLNILYTPGHAIDHVCLLLKLCGQELCIFTGDMILGHGSTTVEDLPSYMNSLRNVRSLIGQLLAESSQPSPTFPLLPAHGDVAWDPLAKIDEYIQNRESRLIKTLTYFSNHELGEWCRESDILKHVYSDCPAALRFAALLNLRHSLFWLADPPDSSDSGNLEAYYPLPVLVARPDSSSTEEWNKLDQFQALLKRYQHNVYGCCTDEESTHDCDRLLHEDWHWKRIA